MVTKPDVLALLEDGPEEASQLAEWLQIDSPLIFKLLDLMDIPRCAYCRRYFVPSAFGATRYCSRDCDQTRTMGRVSFGVTQGSAATPIGGQPVEVPGQHLRRSRRDGGDVEFEVIWNGVGPLPGAGAAAGLGSTLSGIHFSIGRRI